MVNSDRRESSSWRVIEGYRELLDRANRMLLCVRERKWRVLIEEELSFVARVEALGRLEAATALDDIERQYKRMLLENIFARNLEIKQRLLDRQEKLERLIEDQPQHRVLGEIDG